MRSSFVAVASLLLASPAGVLAHPDWVKALDSCWEDCLNHDNGGCGSQKCICDASQSDSFLPLAASCMVSKCDETDLTVQWFFLGPLDLYCSVTGDDIPKDIMDSASAACETTSTEAPSSTSEGQHSHKSDDKTKTHGGALTGSVTSTMTKTTTDGHGNTLELIIPVVMGPGTFSYGKTVTSTIQADATSAAATSAAASPSQTADTPAPTSTVAQEGQAESSTTSSQAAQRTSNSNGSPFENMQAGAGRYGLSGALVALGAVAGLFLRL
ncbi:hypothetical protein EJ04DRAFT_555874 [Polyplosphaeria fusca]|uniref:Extracellular membrane protein CFEM domain-containing protein n=1 Tax=Polyplosphaeria fusca TaxID=682080 RepID=A0A9P4QNU1_9PLEO|nr:hypothetical protein EJ04DRAFT_555874 [Polyplosphaeria fusca]